MCCRRFLATKLNPMCMVLCCLTSQWPACSLHRILYTLWYLLCKQQSVCRIIIIDDIDVQGQVEYFQLVRFVLHCSSTRRKQESLFWTASYSSVVCLAFLLFFLNFIVLCICMLLLCWCFQKELPKVSFKTHDFLHM